jgi:hypothetical protein
MNDDPKWTRRNLAELTDRSSFGSQNAPGQWVMWDFGNLRISPTHYSIKSAKNNHLRSWIVESSLDAVSWAKIDRRPNNSDLNGWHVVASFPVSNSGKCRFIRLTQIGKNHSGFDDLVFSAFDIFGTLVESPE